MCSKGNHFGLILYLRQGKQNEFNKLKADRDPIRSGFPPRRRLDIHVFAVVADAHRPHCRAGKWLCRPGLIQRRAHVRAEREVAQLELCTTGVNDPRGPAARRYLAMPAPA